MGYFVDGFEILSEPCKRAVRQLIASDEKVLYCVASRQKRPNLLERDKVYQSLNGFHNWLDGLIFLEERLIFFQGPKYGFVVSGGDVEQQTLRYNSMEYKEVTSIAVDTRPGANIFFLVNDVSMIMPREAEKELRELENWLRTIVRQKSQQAVARSDTAPREGRDLVGQLEKLAELHRGGSLTDDEFAAMKKKLLEG